MKNYAGRKLRQAKHELEALKELYASACVAGESTTVTDNLAQQIQQVRQEIETLETDIADARASVKYGF